jgi:hypothetical protein
LPCPGPTREVDCSLNNYIDCVLCGGYAGNYTKGVCNGEREETW